MSVAVQNADLVIVRQLSCEVARQAVLDFLWRPTFDLWHLVADVFELLGDVVVDICKAIVLLFEDHCVLDTISELRLALYE